MEDKKALYQKINLFILENAHIAYLVLDNDGNIILCQGNVIHHLGYSADQLINKNIFTTFQYEKQLLTDFRKCKNEAMPFESYLDTHNIHFKVKYLPTIEDNEVVYVISLLIDITQEKRLNTENLTLKGKIRRRELIRNWITIFSIASGLIMTVLNSINLADENIELQMVVSKQKIDNSIITNQLRKMQDENKDQANKIYYLQQKLKILELRYSK